MRQLLLITAALALSASAAMACPYGKKNTEAAAPAERPQSTAASTTDGQQSKPVEVAAGEKANLAVVAK